MSICGHGQWHEEASFDEQHLAIFTVIHRGELNQGQLKKQRTSSFLNK